MTQTVKFSTTDCWILMSVPINSTGVTLSELIGRADALSHAIPLKQELEAALTKGIQSGIIRVNSDNYILNEGYVTLFEEVYKSRGGLFSLSSTLDKKLRKKVLSRINDEIIRITDKQFKQAVQENSENFQKALTKLTK